jgi:LPXTG-motif cell wall-anchored protein
VTGYDVPFTGDATSIYALLGIALFVGGILLVRSSKHDGLEGVDER